MSTMQLNSVVIARFLNESWWRTSMKPRWGIDGVAGDKLRGGWGSKCSLEGGSV